MQTNEIRNHVLSTKTVRNDVYLTAIINTQEKELQRLKANNIELNHKLTNYNVSYHLFYTCSLCLNLINF